MTNTTGNVTSTNGGTGNTASAGITVVSPPTITKAFGAAAIPVNGSTTSLTFTILNPNTGSSLTGLAFTDNLPAGLVVATPNGLTDTCGGTATAVAGSGSVSLSGGVVAASGSCIVSVNVQGTTQGVKNNSVQITSTNGGTGNTSNASITVVAPPSIVKFFGAASVPLNGSTTLFFLIQNNNTTANLSGIAFSDTLPAGLIIATPNGLAGGCGVTITATAGTSVVSLSGASIVATGTCGFNINVTGTSAGTKNNTTGSVTSTEGGTGGTASASLNVVAPPVISKAFGGVSVPLNGTTSLTFTITNPGANAVALTGVAFTDTFPAGLVVATPNGLTDTCGGTATAVAGSGSVSLSGGSVAASGSCTVSVNVTGTSTGSMTNTTGNVTSTNGGTGNTASAGITVVSPPTITKAFGAAAIPVNGSTTSLTFTILNPNTGSSLTGVAFTDNLPAGLVVATPNGLTDTCGGTATAVAGSGSVSLSGGVVAASGSCIVSVNVQGTTQGVKNNSVQMTSTNGGTGNTSNASITVVAPSVIIKSFGAASVPLNGSTSLSFQIQNNNTTTSLSGVAFSDTFPAGLTIATPNGLTGSCGGGTITATAGTSVVSLSAATIAASGSCTFSMNVTGTSAGTKNNTTGSVTSTEGGTGGTASASLNVGAPPSISKAFTPTTIAPNVATSLTFTITNPGANAVALTGVAFTDTFPAGLVVATPNGLTGSCGGGTITAVAGAGSVSLSGATIAVSGSCNFSVNVTGTTTGSKTNTTGNVTSTNGGTGNTASAGLTVDATLPVITLSTLPNEAVTNNFDLNVAGTVTDNTGVQNLTINGTTVPVNADGTFSYLVSLVVGSNVITTVATDLADLITMDTRTIVLDLTAPGITITAPADNSVTNLVLSSVTGTLSDPAAVNVVLNGGAPQAAVMNGLTFTAALNLAVGMNALDITATDLGGHSSTHHRTVTSTALVPDISIMDPGQDTTISQETLTISGMVTALSPATAIMTVDGTPSALTLTGDVFTQAVAFNTAGLHVITVTATDQSANTATVQRNILYSRLGDTNNDGNVTLADAILAFRHALGIQLITDTAELKRCDVAPLGADGRPQPDGVVDIGDVIIIMRKIVGLVNW